VLLVSKPVINNLEGIADYHKSIRINLPDEILNLADLHEWYNRVKDMFLLA